MRVRLFLSGMVKMNAIDTLAQMLSDLNDKLVSAEFADSATIGRMLIAATPVLAERAFDVSNS